MCSLSSIVCIFRFQPPPPSTWKSLVTTAYMPEDSYHGGSMQGSRPGMFNNPNICQNIKGYFASDQCYNMEAFQGFQIVLIAYS